MKNSWMIFLISLVLSSCEQPLEGVGKLAPKSGKLVFDTGEIVFSKDTIKGVCYSESSPDEWVAMVSFTFEGAGVLLRLTNENVGRSMILIFNEKEYSNPTILEPLSGMTPVEVVFLSPSEETKKEFADIFGVSQVNKCFGEITREEFLDILKSDFDAGFSYEEIASKIFYQEYGLVPDPVYELFDEFDFEKMDKENEEYEARMIHLVNHIKNNNCSGVFENLQTNEAEFFNSGSFLSAVFLEQGLCGPKDPATSAKIYQKILDESKDSVSAARMGNLYWNGNGVPINKDKANDLFLKAVLWEPNAFWGGNEQEVFVDSQDTLDFKLWGQTVRQMAAGFAKTETGPWNLPKPLIEKVKWIRGLGHENGVEAFEIAKDLLDGTDGYEEDVQTALFWMAGVASYFDSDEAKFLRPLWGMDKEICNELMGQNPAYDCEWEFDQSLSSMETVAMDGNSKALEFVAIFYSNSDDPWANWSLYQYTLLANKNGVEISREISNRAKEGLGQFEKEIIETWVKEEFGSPISDYLPE